MNMYVVFFTAVSHILTVSHTLFSAHALGLPLLCFWSVQFLKTNISQGSVVSQLTCGGIFNDHFIVGMYRISAPALAGLAYTDADCDNTFPAR